MGGTVVAIGADDTDFVRAGQMLVKLDPADARVALEQAEAQLAQTVREVRTLYANNATLQAQVSLRKADLARVQADAARLQDDVNRRAPVDGQRRRRQGRVSARQCPAGRRTQQRGRRPVRLAGRAGTARRQPDADRRHLDRAAPQRAARSARVREAYLAVQRTQFVAPLDGHVAKRGVQVGQRVQAGAPDDAGGTERAVGGRQFQGKPAAKPAHRPKRRSGGRCVWRQGHLPRPHHRPGRRHGRGICAAARAERHRQLDQGGAARPVRVALDPKELAEHPLRVGLSMDVKVSTADQSGKSLSDTQRTEPVAATRVFDAQMQAADEAVAHIIAANLGRRHAAQAAPRAGARIGPGHAAARCKRPWCADPGPA